MKDIDQLSQLHKLAELTYAKKQGRLQALLAEENDLRAKLSKLTQQQRETATRGTDFDVNALGADILSQSWLGARKTELNMKLARILAMKEQYMSSARKDFGRCSAIENMLVNRKAAIEKKRVDHQLNAAIETVSASSLGARFR